MSERVVANVYFADKNDSLPRGGGDLFPGTIDGSGSISVCGARYAYITGFKSDFIDRNKVERNIHDIFVDYRDFPEIANALSENGVEFGPTRVDRVSDTSTQRLPLAV